MEKIWQELSRKTQAFVFGEGFEKVVLGVSGGIDSAVTAAIACDALGPQNVLGVMLPSQWSSRGSITHARQLAENWGFATLLLPIEREVSSFEYTFDVVLELEEQNATLRGITRENLQARVRAVFLMGLCNEQDRLLLNTCNKSEDYVGYATLYGDSCGAVAPLGGLYKTEVYDLARWVNRQRSLPNIPKATITKAPSAELRPGQRDDDDLPPYDVLDPILRILVDQKGSIKDAVDAGYDAELVKRIRALMRGSEFKRRQSAPVIEITGGY